MPSSHAPSHSRWKAPGPSCQLTEGVGGCIVRRRSRPFVECHLPNFPFLPFTRPRAQAMLWRSTRDIARMGTPALAPSADSGSRRAERPDFPSATAFTRASMTASISALIMPDALFKGWRGCRFHRIFLSSFGPNLRLLLTLLPASARRSRPRSAPAAVPFPRCASWTRDINLQVIRQRFEALL